MCETRGRYFPELILSNDFRPFSYSSIPSALCYIDGAPVRIRPLDDIYDRSCICAYYRVKWLLLYSGEYLYRAKSAIEQDYKLIGGWHGTNFGLHRTTSGKCCWNGFGSKQ